MSDPLKKALRQIVKPGGYDEPVIRAVVLSVDPNTFTCSVKTVTDNLQINGVKLKPVIKGADASKMGVVVFPAVGSFVLVGQVAENNVDLFVISFTQIDSIALYADLQVTSNANINLNAAQITFNSGNNGGIPKVQPVTDAINSLQDQINQLVLAFNAHSHSPSTAPPTPVPSLIPATQGANIDKSTIENTSIKQ